MPGRASSAPSSSGSRSSPSPSRWRRSGRRCSCRGASKARAAAINDAGSLRMRPTASPTSPRRPDAAVRIPGPRPDRTGNRRVRRRGRDAAPGRSGPAAVRSRHPDDRGGILPFRRRVGRPAARARARGGRRRARRVARQLEHFVGIVHGLVTTIEGDIARTTSLLRSVELALVALAIAGSVTSSISRSCSSSGRCTSSRRACGGWPRASST